jgi:hypothetical protein
VKPTCAVVISDLQLVEPEPVYHRIGFGVLQGIADPYCRANAYWSNYVVLRFDHAQKIGRACQRCFPEGVS